MEGWMDREQHDQARSGGARAWKAVASCMWFLCLMIFAYALQLHAGSSRRDSSLLISYPLVSALMQARLVLSSASSRPFSYDRGHLSPDPEVVTATEKSAITAYSDLMAGGHCIKHLRKSEEH